MAGQFILGFCNFPTKNILVRQVAASRNQLFDIHVDYTFTLYLEDTLEEGKNLKVKFPSQYDLWLCDGQTSYNYATRYADDKDYNKDNTP